MSLALFLALVIFITWIVRQQGEAGLEASYARIFTEAVQTYENNGQPELRAYLDAARESQHLRVYLFDEHGNELLGRQSPDIVKEAQRGATRPRTVLWGLVPIVQVHRQSMTSSSGKSYSMVVLGAPSGPFGPGSTPWRAIFIGLISSGLVCYLLARYLTAPVVRLRAAAQKLAAGDLTARAGKAGSRRRDEIAELVRDFDSMAERLETLVNAQSRLLNDISHELRSPLARMNIALELARQRSGPEAQSFLDRMDLESNRLNEMIERLLIIAKLDAGADGLRKEPVHLAELIIEITEDADFEAQGNGCHVRAKIVEPSVVQGNPGLLHSAIENVVRNAARYTAEGTSVEVRLDRGVSGSAPTAIIQVIDSGPGVPEDALDKMFRPFYRIDDARGRQTGGVGLGLAITDRAVRLHGGTVRAMNRPEGGLLVEVRLPLVQALDAVMEPAQSAPVLKS